MAKQIIPTITALLWLAFGAYCMWMLRDVYQLRVEGYRLQAEAALRLKEATEITKDLREDTSSEPEEQKP